ncbi:winged helix-turn-helix transcriptional regulator [Oceanirhabdus seepicola]|uniref:Winged helix-turn-helix transcriptional regulator n=1 Tax=Oceanirhabdus seepicola TaxID=2828781 RepID=A0A9J6P018_9CLOT|nr:winged helix-turn-helix transcriptional regulator [Oceanirhabdus seepicola]MCM1989457.1 winged helix-turn-helix transcriptional regulator [Oceanirhabdus seepicola]
MEKFNKDYVKASLSVIGGKWKASILWNIHPNPMRFNELNRAIPEITKKMLVQQLRELEQDGIIHRTVHNVIPPKVEYSLTEYGETLCPIFKTLHDWGENHLAFSKNIPSSED